MAKSDTPRDSGSKMKPWLRVLLFASLALNLVVAGVLAVGLSLVLPGNWHIIAGSMIAATIGTIIKRRHMRSPL